MKDCRLRHAPYIAANTDIRFWRDYFALDTVGFQSSERGEKQQKAMPPKAKRRRESGLGKSNDPPVTTRKEVKVADDVDQVLAKCRLLRKTLINKSKKSETKTFAQATESESIPGTKHSVKKEDNNSDTNSMKSIVEVSEMSALEVTESIESIAIQIVNQILGKRGFELEIPSRTSGNQIYLPELDRIVLGDKKLSRNFLSVKVRTLINLC